MAKKKKEEEIVTDVTGLVEFDGCEWVAQFDNDPPLILTYSEPGTEDQSVTFILKNNSESHITFTDENTGKRFRIFARKRQ